MLNFMNFDTRVFVGFKSPYWLNNVILCMIKKTIDQSDRLYMYSFTFPQGIMAGIYRSLRLGTTPSHSSSTSLPIVLRHTKAPLVACVTTFPLKSGSCTKSNTPQWNYSLWFITLTWTTTYVCWYKLSLFV